MTVRHLVPVLGLLLLGSVMLPSTAAGYTFAQVDSSNSESASSIEEKDFTSPRGVQFRAEIDRDRLNISIEVTNPTDEQIESTLLISVDGQHVERTRISLPPGDSWDKEWNVRPYIDLQRSNHTVLTATAGDNAQFNVTEDVDPETTSLPSPHIENVSIENGTIDGEHSAVANVTVVNPTIQTYSKKLMLHTTGTDGSFYLASVPPGESRTITVELLDEPGSKIAGEARLYTGDLSEHEGAYDQVEFVGRAGAETNAWNTSYEPVEPYWEDDHYQYENESVTGTDESAISGAMGAPVVAAVVALLSLGVIVRRYRR